MTRPVKPEDDMTSEEHTEQMLTAVNNGFAYSQPATGILSQLFRSLVNVMMIRAFGWSQLMQQYLDNPANGVANVPKDRATARGNLNKELTRPQMSWKVFMKAIRFFGAIRADFTVKLWLPTNKTCEATVTMFDRRPKSKKKPVNTWEIPEDKLGLQKPLFDDDEKTK